MKSHGIVVMLDALGARSIGADAAEQFLDNFRKTAEDVPGVLKVVHAHFSAGFTARAQDPFQLRTFGDTAILFWEVPASDLNLEAFIVTAITVSYFITKGLTMRLCLRGAISTGEVVYDDRSMLGPAITDAASWYDKADLIGAIATPACGQHLSYFEATRPAAPSRADPGEVITLAECFQKYEVPLKDKLFRTLWALNWPRFAQDLYRDRSLMAWYFEHTRALSIPYGTEQKYNNTENFIAEMVRRNDRPAQSKGAAAFGGEIHDAAI